MLAKTILATINFATAAASPAPPHRDAWNDAVDTLSAIAALVAVWLTLSDRSASRRPIATALRRRRHRHLRRPPRFPRDLLQLMDTMPDDAMIARSAPRP